jgi:hypothetical protein
MAGKGTKWGLNQTVEAGKESVSLTNENIAALEPRLEKDEAKQHEANVAELEERRSGQKQTLTDQKSKTGGQKAVISSINAQVVGIRKVVKSKNPTKEIELAFGIGLQIVKTVGGVTAAANIVKDAVQKFPAWSKAAGILDSDITRLTNSQKSLTAVEKTQDESMFTRKARTMGKNELQRAVEDEVTRLSALGSLEFQVSNPGLARMFENLIPSSPKPKTQGKPKKTAKKNATKGTSTDTETDNNTDTEKANDATPPEE